MHAHELGGRRRGRHRGELTGRRRPKERRKEETRRKTTVGALCSRGHSVASVGEETYRGGGRGVQENDDDERKLRDMPMLAETPSRGGARARSHPARVHGMLERRSPRALVHTVPEAMPNDVWGLVLPG